MKPTDLGLGHRKIGVSRVLSFLLLMLLSCSKEGEYSYPLVYTGEVTSISNLGATFNGKIAGLGNGPIQSFGFVWDTRNSPTIENSEKFAMEKAPQLGIYSQTISTTLIAGVTYFVRAYIQSSKYVTYGKEVTFRSLGSAAPTITDFQPKTGNVNDVVLILGKNFSTQPAENIVKFGTYVASVTKATQDTIRVTVPSGLNAALSQVTVSILGNTAQSKDNFNLIPPVFNSFGPNSGTFGTQVSISGSNFLSNRNSVHVYMDKIEARIISIQNEAITIVVPDSLSSRESTLHVVMNNLSASSANQFLLNSVSLNDFSPKVALTGSTITLTGNNFSPIPGNNIVTVGGLNATVTQASLTLLKATVPLQDNNYYPSRTANVKVSVLGDSVSYSNPCTINDQWFRHKDAPADFGGSFWSLASNSKIYLGLFFNNEFWSCDPVNNQYSRLSNFPGPTRALASGFSIGNTIYYGTGYDSDGPDENLKDFWAYDIGSDTWSQKSDFGGMGRIGATAFVINGYGYLGAGQLAGWSTYFLDFWKYDPSADAWIQIPDIGPDCYGLAGGSSTAVGNIGYAGFGGNNTANPGDQNLKWFSYNPSLNKWRILTSFPEQKNQTGIIFNLNGKPYGKMGTSSFYSYDVTNDVWQQETTNPLIINDYGLFGFSIGPIAYLVNGKRLWEYDPNR